MNWKHLLYIIPLVLIIGFLAGFEFGVIGTTALTDMANRIDKCSMQTLDYAMEHNADCKVLISGYMADCYKNVSRSE